MNKLFDTIYSRRNRFLDEMKNSSSQIFEKQNEVINVWKYFTEIRNLYMHAGGRITSRYKNNMHELQNTIGNELEKFEAKKSLAFQKLTFDIEKLLDFEFENTVIYLIKEKKMNFLETL